MSYLRVDCYYCGASWNYYDLQYEPWLGTAIPYQGCICPRCGCTGFVGYYVRGDTLRRINEYHSQDHKPAQRGCLDWGD